MKIFAPNFCEDDAVIPRYCKEDEQKDAEKIPPKACFVLFPYSISTNAAKKQGGGANNAAPLERTLFLFDGFERVVHVDLCDFPPQHQRHENGENDGQNGGEHPHEPADPRDGTEAHHVEDEQAQKTAERQSEENADKACDIDLAVDIARHLVVVISEHHERCELALPLADVDIRQRIDDDEV